MDDFSNRETIQRNFKYSLFVGNSYEIPSIIYSNRTCVFNFIIDFYGVFLNIEGFDISVPVRIGEVDT